MTKAWQDSVTPDTMHDGVCARYGDLGDILPDTPCPIPAKKKTADYCRRIRPIIHILKECHAARPDAEGWQELKLEFTTPEWAPFIDLVFHAETCTAYIDDFSLMPVRKAEK